jgi:PDZ domain-containing protein
MSLFESGAPASRNGADGLPPNTIDPFDGVLPPEEPPRPRIGTGVAVGAVLVGLAIIAGVVVSILPAPYVIERPGPTFDVLGDVEIDGEAVPLISIPGEETFATDGTLRMTTVSLVGSPSRLPSWIEVLGAWFDPSVAVVPVDEVFPPGTTVEQSSEQSRIDMENSQREAVAAALGALEIDLDGKVVVEEVVEGSPAAGILEPGDILLSVDEDDFEDVSGLRAAINEHGVDAPAEVVFLRDGVEQTAQITPTLAEDGETPVLQIYVSSDYDFPFTVDIQLQNVGGPSAGMVFALGILDKLTEGSLTGGEEVAGTGTIAGDGTVGPIGGIRQKLYGARDAGSEWFLAPASNCNEVVGHVPAGLSVFAVATLDDAIAAMDAIREGDTSGLTSCASLVG